jgi:hypothetical protein
LTTRLPFPKTGFSSIFNVFTAVMMKIQVSRDAEFLAVKLEILRPSEMSVALP